jgi:hypothetical protein
MTQLSKVSLITCAREEGDSNGLYQSVIGNCSLGTGELETIELVACKSMGEGYNRAIRQATGEVLVFTHTDVRLWAGRQMWRDMIDLCKTEGTGFVGVAGTTALSDTGVWWMDMQDGVKRGNVAHAREGITYMSFFGPYGDAVVLDGVFLAIGNRFQLEGPWNNIFPEDTGFHFYDIEATLWMHVHGLRNKVIPLPIFHGSHGQISPEWQKAREKFLNRYHDYLPARL